MSTELGIEQVVANWLGDGPMRMPESVFSGVAERIANQPQRTAVGRPRLVRGKPSYSMIAAAAAVALVAIVGITGLLFGEPRGPVASPNAPTNTLPAVVPPTGSSEPEATASPNDSPVGEPTAASTRTPRWNLDDYTFPPMSGHPPAFEDREFVMTAGTYASINWHPIVTFTVPDGWQLHDDPTALTIFPTDETKAGIELLRDVYPPSYSGSSCSFNGRFDVPHSAGDLVEFVTSREGWHGKATEVTLGGLSGWKLVGAQRDSQQCDISYIVDWYDNIPLTVSGLVGLTYVLDDGSGNTIVIGVDTRRAASQQALDVISTFAFE